MRRVVVRYHGQSDVDRRSRGQTVEFVSGPVGALVVCTNLGVFAMSLANLGSWTEAPRICRMPWFSTSNTIPSTTYLRLERLGRSLVAAKRELAIGRRAGSARS